MRANLRMNSMDDLMLAQVRRAQEIRSREVKDMPSDADIEIFAGWICVGVLLTLALVLAVMLP